MIIRMLLLMVVFCCAPALHAAQVTQIPRQAYWFIHLNVNALKKTPLKDLIFNEEILKQIETGFNSGAEDDSAFKDFQDTLETLGIDLIKDFKSLSVFGRGIPNPNTGVPELVVDLECKHNSQALIKYLKNEFENFSTKPYGKHIIFRFGTEDDPDFGAIISPANNRAERFAIATEWGLLAAHLATINGTNESFNPEKSPTGKIIFGRSCFFGGYMNLTRMGLMKDTAESGRIGEVSFALGCDKKKLFAGIHATAADTITLAAFLDEFIKGAKQSGITDPFETLTSPFDNFDNPFKQKEKDLMVAVSNALLRGLDLKYNREIVTIQTQCALNLLGIKPGIMAEGNPFSKVPPPLGRIKGFGTGFFITDNGYILTNHHVVENSKNVSVKYDGKILPAKVIKVDKQNDLAVLKTEGKFKALPLISSRKVKLGDSVFTLGFPRPSLQGESIKMTDGRISSLSGIEDDARNFQISVPIQPGNSGGPLINKDGNVVGIVVSKLNEAKLFRENKDLPQNVNYAVKSSFANSFLESLPKVASALKEANKTKLSTSGDPFSSAVEKGQEATVMIIVR